MENLEHGTDGTRNGTRTTGEKSADVKAEIEQLGPKKEAGKKLSRPSAKNESPSGNDTDREHAKETGKKKTDKAEKVKRDKKDGSGKVNRSKVPATDEKKPSNSIRGGKHDRERQTHPDVGKNGTFAGI